MLVIAPGREEAGFVVGFARGCVVGYAKVPGVWLACDHVEGETVSRPGGGNGNGKGGERIREGLASSTGRRAYRFPQQQQAKRRMRRTMKPREPPM